LFQLVVSLEIVRVGVKIPQDGNRANKYRHVFVDIVKTSKYLCTTGI
jgi:hypothetical protein